MMVAGSQSANAACTNLSSVVSGPGAIGERSKTKQLQRLCQQCWTRPLSVLHGPAWADLQLNLNYRVQRQCNAQYGRHAQGEHCILQESLVSVALATQRTHYHKYHSLANSRICSKRQGNTHVRSILIADPCRQGCPECKHNPVRHLASSSLIVNAGQANELCWDLRRCCASC